MRDDQIPNEEIELDDDALEVAAGGPIVLNNLTNKTNSSHNYTYNSTIYFKSYIGYENVPTD